MKKIAILMLIFCYLAATFGVATYQHYCGNNLTATYVVKLFTKVCSCASEKEMNRCCKETVCFKKMDDKQHNVSVSLLKAKLIFLHINLPISNVIHYVIDTPLRLIVASHAPPPRHSLPIYLSNQQFLI